MTHAMKIARTGTFALIAAAALSSAPVLAQSQSQMPYYARVDVGTKVVVLPMTPNVAQTRVTPVTSYAPVSAPQAAWVGIRPRGIY